MGADKLGEFDHDARLLDLETFRALHGEAFFVHYGALESLSPASALRGTVNSEELRIDGPWLHQYFVFRLRKAPGEQLDVPICIGRTSENDVVIPDESLSRRHAQVSSIAYSESSPWVIRDLGSTNGTYVDDMRLPRDVPPNIVTGSRVRLGSVELTFLLAREFCTLVRRLGPRG
jgi:hypothetical protein